MTGVIFHHLEQLQSMDSTYVCGFAHECSQDVEPEQCPAEIQNVRLCCAHSARSILHDAIIALEDAGRIDQQMAADFRNRIFESSLSLFRLDVAALSEFSIRLEIQHDDVEFLAQDHPIILEQADLVQCLDRIRHELMELCA